jgi:phage terminase large subunit GpA-like protein
MSKAKDLLKEVIHLLEPPPSMTLSEWTIANRYLSAEESSIPGKYDPEFAPFQLGIMDTISNPDVEKVVVMASTRIGKTNIVTNTIGYYADLDPCPILYMRGIANDCKLFSKEELSWLFQNTPVLAGKLTDNIGKDSNNTLDWKKFPGGSIRLIGSNSPSHLSGFAARVVLLDEVDKYAPIPGFGNPCELAEGRTQTFPHNKKIVYISSPTIAHTSNSKAKTIHSEFLQSSQAYYHIPCPHCGTYQVLEWENLRFSHCRETLDDVYYQCSYCDGKITEADKRLANKLGQWVETYPERKTKGFNISQLYSPFSSFEKIAEEWLKVDKSKDIYSIQRFKNEVLGLPFEEDLGLYKDSSDALFNRKERYSLVPSSAYLLTAAVDTQDSWLSYTVTAWGLDRECWVMESGRMDGDPATPGPWEALSEVIYRKYRHESGVEVGIEKVLIDTQGHKTQHVNKYLKGKSPMVQGIYGSRTPNKPIITKAKRDQHTGLRRWEVGTENAKTDIFQMLSTEKPGPHYIHFPFELEESYFKELFSERKVNGKFKQIGQRRNEKLDELGYNLAAYYICIKNYNMETRKITFTQSSIEMNEPDEVEEDEESTGITPTLSTQILTTLPTPPKPPPVPVAPERVLTAREKYLAKTRGSRQDSGGYQPSYWE